MPDTLFSVAWIRRAGSRLLERTGFERIRTDRHGYRVPTQLLTSGYLSDVGWYRSVSEQQIVDSAGRPIPWLVYPAIRLLEERLPSEPFSVFEYGCGASTIWWSQRATSVTSVEHDREWYQKVSQSIPGNVSLSHVPLDQSEDYVRAVLEGLVDYDVIVIDGRRRSDCAPFVLERLTPRGIVIWDNPDRDRYKLGLEKIQAAGFRRLDLHGMAPRDNISSATAVFYREGNLLGI